MNLVDRLLAHPPDTLALVVPAAPGAGPQPAAALSYGQLAAVAARWRGGLVAAGIGGGHRVAVVAGNDEVVVLAELALLGLGAVLVPLNPQSPPAELHRDLAAVEPAGVLVAPAGEEAWAALIADHPRWAALRLDPAPWADAEPAPVVAVPADHPAALLFTSGTAGMPKPAILTHGNLDASLRALLALPVDLVGVPHVALVVIPMFHVFGLHAVLNLCLAAGATVVVEDHHGPARVAELVAAHGVTILSGPPTLWLALATDPAADRAGYGTVTLAVSGAAKLPAEVHRAVEERLGLVVAEGYGLTETCAVVATGVGRSAPVGSVGRLLAGVEARLVGADGHDVLVGDPGELWVRGAGGVARLPPPGRGRPPKTGVTVPAGSTPATWPWWATTASWPSSTG